MASLPHPSQRLKADTTVVSLTVVQHALWQLGMPILDAEAVAKYKKRAKLSMLWREIRWPLLGMTALVARLSVSGDSGAAPPSSAPPH